MTKQVPVVAGADPHRFHAARTAVYAWRGACIGRMADIEYRLSRLLLLTVAHPECVAKSGTLHLTGQKFERLRQILVRKGPIKAAVPDGIAILDRYALFDDLRAYLAHATLELSETENGVMLWTLRLLRFSGATATSSALVMTEAEARTARQALLASGRAVVAMFDRVEAALALPSRPAAPYPLPVATACYPLTAAAPAPLTPAAATPRS